MGAVYQSVPMAVFHNLTMERDDPPTIQNNPFHLTSPECEGYEDKWNRQGELSRLPQFWADGGLGSTSPGLGMY